MLTIPYSDFTPTGLPVGLQHVVGQAEIGESGYHHWQIVVGFKRTVRLAAVKKTFGITCHAEPTRSDAAYNYVCKDSTSIPGTRFEFG